MVRFVLATAAVIAAVSAAPDVQGAENPAAPGVAQGQSALKEIGPGRFQLGKVRFHQKEKTVSFPAIVNFREGPIEYLVVTTSGKIHESVLRTEVEPRDIHVAMLLLGAKGAGTNSFPADATGQLPGEILRIEVSWGGDRKTRRFGEELVRDRKANRVMKKGVWIYNGSRLREDGFAAQQDGSIVSVIADPDALVNNPRPGREDDDNWLANTRVLPPLETPVEVTFRLKP